MPGHWWVELGLGPLVGGAMSRGMSRGGCGPRKLLGSLSADGWGCVPALLFGLRCPSTGVHRLFGVGQVLVPKWQSPGQFTLMDAPQCTHHWCPCPHSEPHLPSTFTGDPLRPAGRSGPGSYEVTAFALGPGAHETLCAPSQSGVSVSPSPVELLHSSAAGLQSQMLWGLLLLMPNPQAEEPEEGLRTLLW